MVKLGKYDAEEVKDCPICGGNGDFVLTTKARPEEDIMLSFYICDDCQVVYQNPRMTKEATHEYYSNGDYFEYKSKRDGGCNHGERHRALARMALILNLKGIKKPTRALDIGCGQGHFLQRVQDWSKDVETVGYDKYPDPEAVHLIISDKSEITGEFDFISCMHTLEHMYDPMAQLVWMESILVKGGCLYIEVPVKKWLSLAHPVTFSKDTVPIIMKHVNITSYTWIDAPPLESVLVFGIKTRE
jgi:SAM-dependent methyltransferase